MWVYLESNKGYILQFFKDDKMNEVGGNMGGIMKGVEEGYA